MNIIGDNIFFSTGKVVNANGGLIGLSESSEYGWRISEGWDGGIDCDNLTKKEKIELADYMVNLWQRFKQQS